MFADLVRRSGKPVIVVANKAEGAPAQAGALEAYALGLGEPVAVSAEHGEGLADLYEALRATLPAVTGRRPRPRPRRRSEPTARSASPWSAGRTAGKSTLVNRLLGEERLLTGPEAGITRDTIAVDLALAGAQLPPARHRRAAPHAAGRGEAREALGRRCDQCDPLRRGGGAADGCRAASRSRTCASPIWWSAKAGRW